MSALGERCLLIHLLDADSLAVIAREGLEPEMIPSEELRQIVGWAVDYYFRSGRTQAPSSAALRGVEAGTTTFGAILDDHEIDMEHEAEDSVEWALDDLRSTYVHKETQRFNREFATDMAGAASDERVAILNHHASNLVRLSISLVRKDIAQDLRTAIAGTLLDYEDRETNRDQFRGMRLGLSEVDAHSFGIHEGELAVWAGAPKLGKSFALAWAAYTEWHNGRAAALFTLENSVEMTLDRIACMAMKINFTDWQRGLCSSEAVEAVREWQVDLEKSETPLWVVQPDLGRRSIEQMVREAQVREAQSLLIDQLTFVELPSARKPKHERIGEGLHTLKGMISTGRNRMSCLLAHQINREGVKAADKVGYLEMYHMAEAAEVERTADLIYGGYASRDDQMFHQIKLQLLGARRVPLKNWQVWWTPERGDIRVLNEFVL
jgi:hypothetical protein